MADKTQVEEEQEYEEEVIKTGVLGWLGYFFGFLWFMRRLIVGAILLYFLGYAVYKVANKPKPNFDDGASVAVVNSSRPDLPGAPTITENPKVDQAPKSKIEEADRKFYETASVDELTENILILRDTMAGKPNPTVMMMSSRVVKLARRLMEHDINQNLQVFALTEYIDAVVTLDTIASVEKMKSAEARVAVDEIIQKYLKDDRSPVRARACLANIAVRLNDYARDRDLESLEIFSSKLDEFADEVLEEEVPRARLCRMLLWLRRSRDWDGTAVPYCLALIKKMEESSNAEAQRAAPFFREQVYFEHLELKDLLSRMDQGDQEADRLVLEFFGALEVNPNVRTDFFQIAISVVEKTKMLQQKELYQERVEWLTKISKTISSEPDRAEILEAIGKVEAIAWDDVKDENVPEQDETVAQ